MPVVFTFVSVARSGGGRMQSSIRIEDSVRLQAPLTGFGTQVTVAGPEDFSLQAKGAHALQSLEVALFMARTVLSTNSEWWSYEDEAGQPLDFSYAWPPGES